MSVSSVKVYLFAVRRLNIVEGHGNPLQDCMRVRQALRALEIQADPPHRKLPITLEIMQKIHALISSSPQDKCMWAAMTVAFFGCFRASELTVPARSPYNHTLHISNADVHPRIADKSVTIQVKHSKTDKLNKGFSVIVGCSGFIVCGHCALLDFLAWKQLHSSTLPTDPFFILDGKALCKDVFVNNTRIYLALLGFCSKDFSGHSFRAGSATTAAAAGLADWEIKLLGRWTSEAYQSYIRAPGRILTSFAHRMCASTSLGSVFNYRAPYIANMI